MDHFVYRITILNKKDERKYYVGKHSGSVNDFKNKRYFTSSKVVSQLLRNSETKYKVKIVKTFQTSNDALRFEGKYHNRVDVKANLKFFNIQNKVAVFRSAGGDSRYLIIVLNK